MAPEAKGGKCPSGSSCQNSEANNPQSAPSAAHTLSEKDDSLAGKSDIAKVTEGD